MERKYFKALNFDLDTHQLKTHYIDSSVLLVEGAMPNTENRIFFQTAGAFFSRHLYKISINYQVAPTLKISTCVYVLKTL